jgi:hypothetical protein
VQTVLSGSFQNLGFEEPNLSHLRDDPLFTDGSKLGPATEVFCNWAVKINDFPLETAIVSTDTYVPAVLRAGS